MSNTPEFIDWSAEDDYSQAFEFNKDGQLYSVPKYNTTIRRFDQGEGGFDYLVHLTPKGKLVFMPGIGEAGEIFEDLESRGFRVEALEELDEEAILVFLELELRADRGSAAA